MKISVCFLFFLTTISYGVSAKKLGISSGINYNTFFLISDGNDYSYGRFKGHAGFNISIFTEKSDRNKHDSNFILRYENYGGEFKTGGGSLGGSYSTSGTVNKSVLTLGIYFLNIGKRKTEFSLGFGLGLLLHEKTEAHYFQFRNNSYGARLKDVSGAELNNKVYGGILLQLDHEIALKNNFYLIPKFNIFCGFTGEITDESGMLSFRQALEVGIAKGF
jgi:hypothetical protein